MFNGMRPLFYTLKPKCDALCILQAYQREGWIPGTDDYRASMPAMSVGGSVGAPWFLWLCVVCLFGCRRLAESRGWRWGIYGGPQKSYLLLSEFGVSSRKVHFCQSEEITATD